MLRLALRSALERRRRFVATLSAVALAVSFMSGALIFSDTLRASINDLFSSIFAGTDVVVRSNQTVEGFFDEQRASLDDDLIERVRGVDGVADAVGDLQNRFALIIGADGEPLGNGPNGSPTFLFAWSDSEELSIATIVEGRAPEGPDEVVINRGAAIQGDLAIGDRVTIITGQEPGDYELVGIVSVGGQDNLAGETSAAFDLATAQELAGQPGRVDSISVAADPGVSTSELRARVAAALSKDDVEVITGEEVVEEQRQAVAPFLNGFRRFLLVFAGVTLFVGSFIIYNTFSILLTQRTRELALLRAIGAARRQVLGSVLAEAVAVGLVASLAGVVLGLGTATLIRGLMTGLGIDLPEHALLLTGGTALACLVTGLAVTLGSALLPAIKASRVSPLAAMRSVGVDTSARSRLRLGIGLLVLAAGVGALLDGLFAAESNEGYIVGFGAAATFLGVVVLGPIVAAPFCRLLGRPLARGRIVGELAVQNAARNPRRTAGTAAALMIGVGLVSLITVFAESVRTTINQEVQERFRGDLVIDSGSFGFGGLPPTLAEELRGLDEVQAVAAIRFALVGVDGKGQLALGIDPAPMGQIMDLQVAEGDLAALQPGEVAVALDAMRFHDWDLGDEIELTFAETGAQRFRIAAVTSESALAGGGPGDLEYTLHNEDLAANIPQPFDVALYLRFASGVETEAGLAAVSAVAEAYPNANVLDLAGYAQQRSDEVNQFLGLIFGLLFLAIIVALIGIANTLSLSIVERTREIGLLRAVGMTRRQLRAAVRGEAMLIALLGTLLGLGVGVFLGVSLVVSLADDGLELAVPPGQLLTIAVLGALAGVLSSVIPARRVAKLDVLDSIASE